MALLTYENENEEDASNNGGQEAVGDPSFVAVGLVNDE